MEYIIKKESKGLYIGETETSAIAHLDYYISEKGYIVATRTFVDPSLRGQGIAFRLFVSLTEIAEQEKLTIKPLCSYVSEMLKLPKYNIYLNK